VAQKERAKVMNEIKENGYVRWKGFLTTMGANFLTTMGIVFAMFLYLDSKMMTKPEFVQYEKAGIQFKKQVLASFSEIKVDIRHIYKGGPEN